MGANSLQLLILLPNGLQNLQPSAGSVYLGAHGWASGAIGAFPWGPALAGLGGAPLQSTVWSVSAVQVCPLQLFNACRVGGWVLQPGFVAAQTLQLAVVFWVVTVGTTCEQ